MKSLNDVNSTQSQHFAVAGESNATEGLKVGAQNYQSDKVLAVKIPANTILTEDEAIAVSFEHSDDNENFTPIPQLATVPVVGIAGDSTPTLGALGDEGYVVDGAGNVIVRVPLPDGTKDYVRASVDLSASNGDLTALQYQLSLSVY